MLDIPNESRAICPHCGTSLYIYMSSVDAIWVAQWSYGLAKIIRKKQKK